MVAHTATCCLGGAIWRRDCLNAYAGVGGLLPALFVGGVIRVGMNAHPTDDVAGAFG
jgi:hypothetical protein